MSLSVIEVVPEVRSNAEITAKPQTPASRGGAVGAATQVAEMDLPDRTHRVLLVEGDSDVAAVQTLARRIGRDLRGEGVAVVAVGGASRLPWFLERLGRRGLPVGGLIDRQEMSDLLCGLRRAGLGGVTSRDLDGLGFFVCDADLEDELVRAVGPGAVVDVVEAEGELGAFRTMQRQPPWRDRSLDAQLRRFIGVKSGRKLRYAALLTAAAVRVPAPLEALLASV